jgi:hypothetical protein
VRQFEEQKEGLSTLVQSKYEQLTSKSQEPDLRTAKEFLLESIESFPSGVYIIFDGFDECKEDGRRALVDCLRSFVPRDKRFRFFVASRPNGSVDLLASRFGDEARRIEISSGQRDVTRDLKEYVETRLLDMEEELEDGETVFISERIIAKAQGL